VNWGVQAGLTRDLGDGLGIRHVETDVRDGSLVEVLEIAPAIAGAEGFEPSLRARAARMASVHVEGLTSVRRIERSGAALRVIADHVPGLRLPDLLHESLKGNIPLIQPAALELAGQIVRIVSALHQVPGLCHGAITPAHVVITRTGEVVLTDGIFGSALEGLQRSREQYWREFRVALPPSAGMPRFDQRADVAQLGATVLAVALGRPLTADEFPRAVNEAVTAATIGTRPGETGTSASALRMWLQEAMFLHPRATLNSAVDAERAFDEVLGPAVVRRGGAAAFQYVVQGIFGDTAASAAAAQMAAAWSLPDVVHPAPLAPAPDPVPLDTDPHPDDARRPITSIIRSFRF
jgi:hypothetical protein